MEKVRIKPQFRSLVLREVELRLELGQGRVSDYRLWRGIWDYELGGLRTAHYTRDFKLVSLSKGSIWNLESGG
jgi:hypothetical protein